MRMRDFQAVQLRVAGAAFGGVTRTRLFPDLGDGARGVASALEALRHFEIDVAAGLKPCLQSAQTSLGCFSRLVKRHHSIDHQIHRSLSFLKCFSLSDCPQVAVL